MGDLTALFSYKKGELRCACLFTLSTWHDLKSCRKGVSMSNYLGQVGLWTCLWELSWLFIASCLHEEMKAQLIVGAEISRAGP